ncbi:MAG: hypothetical protein HWN71_03685 [Desulfobacterales bacterium]|nr:hypothetical protein [Desulfobacterales bacterium]
MFWIIYNIGDNVSPKRKNWKLYADMVTRTAKAQALTAQELDIRNFFQRFNIQFWIHPVWKVDEDQCFYVYDFAFCIVPNPKISTPTFQQSLSPLPSQDPNLWLLECSYTTLKPGAAKHFLRKRCSFIDRKFRAAKHRGMSTVLLLEALQVPPRELCNNLPELEYINVLFTSVEAFKGWLLDHLEGKDVRQETVAKASPKLGESRQAQLNGFLRARETPDTANHYLDAPYSNPSRTVPANARWSQDGW